MCTDCHRSWNVSYASALLTHPIIADFEAALSLPSINPAITYNSTTGVLSTNVGQGEVRVLYNSASGKYMVSCTSCHGTHYTDSDSTTSDGMGVLPGTAVGDGKLLRTDGSLRTGATSAETAQLRSNLCQACHTYKTHGKSSGEEIGCLVCHSGHSYNGGSPNYFVLRNQINDVYVPKTSTVYNVTGLVYTSMGSAETMWGSASGNDTGYCERCHGDYMTMSSGRAHQINDKCADCHNHGGATYSFEASGGCNGCHGYPPTQDVAGGDPNAGYADNGVVAYADSTPPYKNEALTPHAAHAAGSGNYSFSCDDCHKDRDHNTGAASFQDVFIGTTTLSSGGGNMAPVYNPAGSGTCSAVYCHSNGGARTGDNGVTVTRSYTAASIPVWENGLGAIIGKTSPTHECTFCHDNSASMTNGSSTHAAHLALTGVSCNTCHYDTAVNSTTLTGTAIGDTHVNGTVDVVFDTSITVGATPYTATTGVCAVYCHTDAKASATYSNPDWDLAASGACGTCHDTTGEFLDGAHKRHVFDADGPSLACTTCHTNNGTGSDHVNGSVSWVANYQNTVCNPCHGATATVTVGNDREPIWTQPSSVDCRTCHVGVLATINVQAPAKDAFDAEGHGDPALTGAPDCTGCHDAGAAGHLGALGENRLIGGAAANDAFCQGCHATHNSHYADSNTTGGGSTDGNACLACHEAHGGGMGTNTDAMLVIGSNFTDRLQRSSYVNGSNTGVCQVCHVAADGSGGSIDHYNQTDPDDGHNDPQVCTDCHLHTDSPGFKFDAGTNCGDCHAYAAGTAKGALTSGAHAAHITVVDGDKVNEDLTDCAQCHGATVTSYTYASGGNHMNGTTDFVGGLGYDDNGTRGNLADDLVTTCAGACHATASGQTADWVLDTSLSCDSCHGNAPATGGGDGTAHVDHISAGLTCGTCHDVTNGTPTDLSHITDASGANEGEVLAGRAQALASEVLIEEPSWGVGGANTCNNASCHNPSGTTYLAAWDVDTSACNLCHGNAPATGAHGKHVFIGNNTDAEDLTDCANCHLAAAGSYGYGHRDGTFDIDTAGIGYSNNGTAGNLTDDTCASACHNSSLGDGFWTDTALDCTACHGNPPATGGGDNTAHADHLAAGLTCGTCHDTVGGTPTDTTHITDVSGTHGQQIIDKATADATEVLVGEASWNGTDNTCSNVACHNPSDGGTYKADWDTSIADDTCTLCHSSSAPGSGSHTPHLGASAQFNVSATCADCHGTAPTTDDHRDGTVTVLGGLGYDGTVTNTTSGSWGSCSTTTCHNRGDLVTAQPTPTWGTASADCTICHTAPPATGDHSAHMSRSGNGMTCNSCHSTSASDSSTAGGSGHIDGSRYDIAAGGSYTGVGSVVISSYVQGSPSTCTANCHSSNPKSWEVPTTCEGCHSNLTADTTHAAHINISPTIAADVYDCMECHGAAVLNYTVGGGDPAHQTGGPIDFATNIADGGTSPDWTCSGACHSTATGTTTLWSATSLACDACHGNAPATGGGDGTAHADHISAGMTCGTCHDVTNGTPTDLSHITDASGLNEGEVLAGRAQALASEVLIEEPSWGIGGANTCNNASCHNPSGTTFKADWTAGTGSVSACDLCHAATSGDPTTGSHTSHRTAGTLYGNNVTCAECHTVPGVMNHRDGTPDVNGSKISLWTNPSCSTSCHSDGITSPGNSPNWGAEASSCGLCHVATPTSGSHTNHLNNGSYVSGCGACHAAETDTTHINGSKDFNGSVAYDGPGTGTCSTNNCHGGSADWTDAVPSPVCLDCHSSGKIGTAPSTGLHTGTLTVSGNTHDDNFQVTKGEAVPSGTCETCHGTTPSSAHMTGVLSGAQANFVPTVNKAGSGEGSTCSPGTGSPDLSGCHDDGGAWARIWSSSARDDATPDNECANCHGDFASGFVSGMGLRHETSATDLDGQIENNHDGTDKCSLCHNYIKGDTTYYNAATLHRDGNLQINSNVGFVDNADNTVGCNKCHSADDGGTLDEQHNFEEVTTTRWTRSLEAGPPVSCATCHGYPPTAGDGIDSYGPVGEGKGAHPQHVYNIAQVKVVTLDANSDTFVGNAVCGACHDVSSDANHSTAGGGSRNLSIDSGYQFGVSAPSYGGFPDGTSSSTQPKTCSSVSCHFKETPLWSPIGGE